ncbi:MAG: ATP-binding protein [Anaerobutyricum sp.]
MFIGRRKELDAMQSLYDKDGFGMMVIYGRRRIGKSTLINEFIKNKNAIFIQQQKLDKIETSNYLLNRLSLC